MTKRQISTYFSHSYRLEDQAANKDFWRLFDAEGFYFSVDPPSNNPTHAHLERMMNRSSCYVAVVNRRLEAPEPFCSRFILYEFGLSLQAKVPRLLLVDQRIPAEGTFGDLQGVEIHPFDHADPLEKKDDLIDKIRKLKTRARGDTKSRRGRIGLLLHEDSRDRAYGGLKVQERIRETARRFGFECKDLVVPYVDNAEFALALDACEAIVLDVRGNTLPKWVFSYTHARLVPSIKLVRVMKSELPEQVVLPPVVAGLQMDPREPGIESVTYWRDADDLIHQLAGAFEKLDEEPTKLDSAHQGELYFDSIHRRPARVFISNGAAANPLARRLSDLLRLHNIGRFQYKDEGAIPTGSDWRKKIVHELEICQVFVALVGRGYEGSSWCRKELRVAAERARRQDLRILPYRVDDVDVRGLKELGPFEVTDRMGEVETSARQVFDEIDQHLKDHDAGKWVPRQPFMLGASNEAVVDALRSLPAKGWDELRERMAQIGVDIGVAEGDRTPRPRRRAEELIVQVQRAVVPLRAGIESQSTLGFLVDQLAELAEPDTRRPTLEAVAERLHCSMEARA